MKAGQSFDEVARNLAEVIDAILTTPRERQRRIELIRHQIRHALSIGYKTGRGISKEAANDPGDR
jgi:hypothetical protein